MPIGHNHPQQGAYSRAVLNTSVGDTFPLGAHVDGETTAFAVYSKNAARVLLEIYEAPMRKDAQFDYWMEPGPDHVWRARVNAVPPGTLYGFRCWGPNWTFSPDWQRGGSA